MDLMTDDPKFTFVNNMFTLVNWGGIPATDSQEVAEVLRYHLSNMRQMPKGTLEFMAALEAAKVLDRQYHDLRTREMHENPGILWVQERRWKPLVEGSTGEQGVSSDTSSTAPDDPKTT